MANFKWDTYVIPPAPGDVSLQIVDKNNQHVRSLVPKTVTIAFVNNNLVKVKTKGTNHIITFDFATHTEALLALEKLKFASDQVTNVTGPDIDIDIKNYIDTQILNMFSNSIYTHNQAFTASTWVVEHKLGYKPGGLFVTDRNMIEIEGLVRHIDNDTSIVQFNKDIDGWVFVS